MKQRPILFSAPMVRALLDGTKIQTRRVVKRLEVRDGMPEPEWASLLKCCPYGQPGDQLWVKETHLPIARGVMYRADFSEFDAAGTGALYGGWKPSIFCKREHSRITLEITGVRVERLQDISRGDAMAEGCPLPNMADGENPRKWYADLWQAINGPGSWELNPFVWVIEFRRDEA